MPQGIIIKGVGGFYYVKTELSIVECRARGKFRNEKLTPLVGDIVNITEQSGSGVIDSILPRKNVLIRPAVANIDQAVIVLAAAKPEPNTNLLDRFLLLIERDYLDITICINKIDLIESTLVQNLMVPYKQAGYNILYTSTITGYGIDMLKDNLKDRTSVFAGPSGVGKSKLLNTLQPSFNMKTGEISSKIERGRHTTRHSELLELDTGGFVVDTPGFTSLNIDSINKVNLQNFFPEFNDYIGLCRFSGCSHINEPDCAVKNGVISNKVSKLRYDSYLNLYNEISKVRRNY